jgi:TRAP-type uncharacterized transport system substrate-binding protein
MPVNLPDPRIQRKITVQFMGDWGVANLHRICGWLMAEMRWRSGAGSRFATWSGAGGTESLQAVLDGTVDVAFFVPAGFVRTAWEGKGILPAADARRLRAIGTFPQDDRLVIAVDSKLGIRSLADLRARKPAIAIALAFDDGDNMTGYATNRLLDAAGLSRPVIQSWGGSFLEGEGPWDTISLATEGKADAVIFEAVMTPYWRELLARRDMTFLPVDDEVLIRLEREYGWARGTVPGDRFKGLSAPFKTLDFSDFLLVCREDLDEDIAYLMAWCGCEKRAVIERQYKHLPPKDSPLTYPLMPEKIARTSIPLHPGAERYYRAAGLIKA